MTAPSSPVLCHPGKLPPLWDRQAIFVANLLALFFGNEEGTDALAREIGEVDSYGGRLLPVLNLLFRGGENMLVLERAPDPALANYFSDSLELRLPDVEVLSHRDYLTLDKDNLRQHPLFRRLEQHPAPWIDGYVTDRTLRDLAVQSGKQTISSPSGSRQGNNKRLLHDAITAAGLPTPTTFIADDQADICRALDRLRDLGFRRAAVKAAIGASGIGLARIPLDQPPDPSVVASHVNSYYFYEGACLVQGWLEPGVLGVTKIRSPSVQIFAGDNASYLYDITEQILSHHSVHEGNEAPPPYLADPQMGALRREVLDQAQWAASWLHEQGYRGTASADFLWIEFDDGRTEIQICEINARVTGATYPALLARHFLPHGHWLLRNLRLDTPLAGDSLLDILRQEDILFLAGRDAGVLPVNFNTGADDRVHKGQFLCIGESAASCHQILDRTCNALPCASDRD